MALSPSRGLTASLLPPLSSLDSLYALYKSTKILTFLHIPAGVSKKCYQFSRREKKKDSESSAESEGKKIFTGGDLWKLFFDSPPDEILPNEILTAWQRGGCARCRAVEKVKSLREIKTFF